MANFHSSKLETLASEVFDNLQESQFDPQSREFLPATKSKTLVTKNRIEQELRCNDRELIDWITQHGRKIFLAIIQSDLHPAGESLKAICLLRSHNYTDETFEADDRLDHGDKHQLAKSRDLNCFPTSIWNKMKYKNFCQEKSVLCTPIFDAERDDYHLPTRTVLPFVWRDRRVTEGAFSNVYRATIHEDHAKHGHTEVAIKEMKPFGIAADTEILVGDSQTDEEISVRARSNVKNRWEDEARALKAIKALNGGRGHDHIMPFLGSIQRGSELYFMFPWANGGSLQNYWEKNDHSKLSAGNVHEALEQLLGVARALQLLHDPESAIPFPDQEGSIYQNQSIRHGDIKPENLLWFTNIQTDGETKRTLKIADMGLAKQHWEHTHNREFPTREVHSTPHYEAPDARRQHGARSRLYDVWSLGCVMLEWIIWILWSNRGLKRFREDLEQGNGQLYFYSTKSSDTGDDVEVVHAAVGRWIRFIRENHPQCIEGPTSALRDLLEIVQMRLLVVDLPPPTRLTHRPGTTIPQKFTPPFRGPGQKGAPATRFRATAEQLCSELKECYTKASSSASSPEYLLRKQHAEFSDLPPTPTEAEFRDTNGNRDRMMQVYTNIANTSFETWEFTIDNTFSRTVLEAIKKPIITEQAPSQSSLCSSCAKHNILETGFHTLLKASTIEKNLTSCKSCRVLREIMKPSLKYGSTLAVHRQGSTLSLTDGPRSPICSILISPGSKRDSSLQLGLPPTKKFHDGLGPQLMGLWLKDCDKRHAACGPISQHKLPTRLLDVGTFDSPMLRLVDTAARTLSNVKYLALSHPWGDTQKQPPFCTYRHDTSGQGLNRFLTHIDGAAMPQTFRDAVEVTRTLGVRYLWIDSLCVIQGPDGDFKTEAPLMGRVFGGAYCVIAACSATGQHTGFLGEREPRSSVSFNVSPNERASMHICHGLDDFQRDVLSSNLNRRGWVLQERALARRTIFFTDTQLYFECGEGIRCESLTRMRNPSVGILGDPRFPEHTLKESTKGQKLQCFQRLFSDYSALEFTHDSDRAIAITGLECRLRKGLGTDGRYGIFGQCQSNGHLGEDFFHRSLLWKCKDETIPLKRIVFETSRSAPVPSWSWMAYKGAIGYYSKPPQGQVVWSDDVAPAWASNSRPPYPTTSDLNQRPDTDVHLKARVRSFQFEAASKDEYDFHFDNGENSAKVSGNMCCVVVGVKSSRGLPTDKEQYVLLVRSVERRGKGLIYERIGVGTILGRHLVGDHYVHGQLF